MGAVRRGAGQRAEHPAGRAGRGVGGGGAEPRGAAESGAEPRSRRVGNGSGKPDGAGRGASAQTRGRARAHGWGVIRRGEVPTHTPERDEARGTWEAGMAATQSAPR